MNSLYSHVLKNQMVPIKYASMDMMDSQIVVQQAEIISPLINT